MLRKFDNVKLDVFSTLSKEDVAYGLKQEKVYKKLIDTILKFQHEVSTIQDEVFLDEDLCFTCDDYKRDNTCLSYLPTYCGLSKTLSEVDRGFILKILSYFENKYVIRLKIYENEFEELPKNKLTFESILLQIQKKRGNLDFEQMYIENLLLKNHITIKTKGVQINGDTLIVAENIFSKPLDYLLIYYDNQEKGASKKYSYNNIKEVERVGEKTKIKFKNEFALKEFVEKYMKNN